MEFIKLSEDRYLIKDSKGIIVNKKKMLELKKDKKEVVKNGTNTIKKTK